MEIKKYEITEEKKIYYGLTIAKVNIMAKSKARKGDKLHE